LIQIVQDSRKNDEDNDKVFQKHCRKIMRELHNIPEDQLAWNGPVQRKKVTAPPAPIDPSKRKKIRVKEQDLGVCDGSSFAFGIEFSSFSQVDCCTCCIRNWVNSVVVSFKFNTNS